MLPLDTGAKKISEPSLRVARSADSSRDTTMVTSSTAGSRTRFRIGIERRHGGHLDRSRRQPCAHAGFMRVSSAGEA